MQSIIDDQLLPAVERGKSDSILFYYLSLRNEYKGIEAGMEYFMPATSKALNGAPIPEVELEGNTEVEPTGLQVMEPFIFPVYDTANKIQLLSEIRKMRSVLLRANQIWEVQLPTVAQYWDALYYEMIRVVTMGIAGFDTPGTGTGIKESSFALQTVNNYLQIIEQHKNTRIDMLLGKAIEYLNKNTGFNTFDRALFIRRYWQPAFAVIASERLKLLEANSRSAISKNATGIFGNQFFDASFFTSDSMGTNSQLAALGEKLFYDTRLSFDGSRSCASCHQPELYFTDNKKLSDNIHGTPLSRNTPSLLNTVFQTNYFWDLRALNLEMQAKFVVDNQFEMHGSLKEVCKLLNKDASLNAEVKKVFGTNEAINETHIMQALASYQRTLIGFNSPFDAYMNGKDNAITGDAIEGFNLFMGKAKCGSCHFMPAFSGLVPPHFDRMESEVIGTPATAANAEMDKDKGRGELFPAPTYMHAFKTPTVRNAAVTFPYMHNGAYNSLDEVMEFYNKGGGVGLGYEVLNQTLPFDSLGLNNREKKQIVAFIESLTDQLPKQALSSAKRN